MPNADAAPNNQTAKSGSHKTAKSAKPKSGPVKSESAAVAIVAARPEVKSWVATIKASKIKGTSSHIEFDRMEDGEYIVHVYEYVPDDAESGHTATMNWYHVNAKTGKVSKEF
jgi:hypothetical protein